jgi:4-hydroxyphenylacetate 3-monooxygenase
MALTRTGADFLASLRNGRSVYLDGQRVADVQTHPAFATGARSVAGLYDVANDPANRDLMTFPSERDGRPVNKCFLIPRNRDDLVARRMAHKRWSDQTYGLLGRSPDHVAGFLSGFAGSTAYFAQGGAQFAENVRRFYEKAADEDLYVAYAIIHPTIDRSRPAHQQPEPNLYASVLKEVDGGVIIRGAQMLATGAVYADYAYISVIGPLRPGDEDYALSFVVPTGVDGLKIYVRRPYSVGPTSVYDYPLSSRFDETDALLVFDDVFVPWESFFVYRDRDLTAGQFTRTAAHVLGNTQAQIRFWSKLQFLVGLVKRISDRNGQSERMEVQAEIGNLAARAALVEGLILAAEEKSIVDEYGVARPSADMVYANQTLQSSIYPEVVMAARQMMGGSLIQLPSSVEDLRAAETSADMRRYVRWPHADVEERVKLLKLLWDLTGSEFGSRHVQYEMFYAGQPTVVQTKEYRAYDWAAAELLVDACLESYDARTEDAAPMKSETNALNSRGCSR